MGFKDILQAVVDSTGDSIARKCKQQARDPRTSQEKRDELNSAVNNYYSRKEQLKNRD